MKTLILKANMFWLWGSFTLAKGTEEPLLGPQNRAARPEAEFDRFAARETVPKYVLEGLMKLRGSNEETRRRERQQSAVTLLQMLQEAQLKEEEFRASQPRHVREVQKDKQHVLLLELAQLAGDPDVKANRIEWEENLRLGTPVVGEIPKTWKWRGEVTEAPEDFEKISSGKKRTKPPGHMVQGDLERLWTEFENEKFGGGNEIAFNEAEGPITYVFGVNQGAEIPQEGGGFKSEKLRRILDFRPLNKNVKMLERLRLIGHLGLITMIQLLIAIQPQLFPAAWGAKDITHDVYGFYRMPEQEYDRSLWDKIVEAGEAFAPYIAKLDFRRYYFQFAVRTPKLNVAAVWDPYSGKYRYFEMPSCQFGSLFSIFYACRVSELLSRIATVLLCVVTVIYIDDSIILAKDDVAEETALLGLLFCVLGFDPSSNKEECMVTFKGGQKTIHEQLTVLGLAYKRLDDLDFRIGPDLEKILKAQRLCNICLKALKDGDLVPKMLEKLLGLMIFMVYFSGSRQLLGRILRLAKITAPGPFRKAVGTAKRRACLQCEIEDIRSGVSEIRDLELTPRRLDAPLKKVFTDASLEKGISGVGGLATNAKGQIRDARSFSIFLKQEDWNLGSKPASIQTFEALAVLIALRMWKEDLKKNRVILHIDNIAVLFVIAKGSHKDPVIACIAEMILTEISDLPVIYSLYVKSKASPSDALTREDLLKEFLEAYDGEIEDAEEVTNKIRAELVERLLSYERRRMEAEEWQRRGESSKRPLPQSTPGDESGNAAKRRRTQEKEEEGRARKLEVQDGEDVCDRTRKTRRTKKRKTNKSDASRCGTVLPGIPGIRVCERLAQRQEIPFVGSEALCRKQRGYARESDPK